MKIELELEEGDVISTNDKEWEVFDIHMGRITLDPVVGEPRTFSRDEIESIISASGRVRLVKEEYLGF